MNAWRELVGGLIKRAKSSSQSGDLTDRAGAFQAARPSQTCARPPRVHRIRVLTQTFGGRLDARPARGHGKTAGNAEALASCLPANPWSPSLSPACHASGSAGQPAHRRTHHVRRRPRTFSRRQIIAILDCASSRTRISRASSPRPAPPDRRDLCFGRDGKQFPTAALTTISSAWIDPGRAGRTLDPDPGLARSAGDLNQGRQSPSAARNCRSSTRSTGFGWPCGADAMVTRLSRLLVVGRGRG